MNNLPQAKNLGSHHRHIQFPPIFATSVAEQAQHGFPHLKCTALVRPYVHRGTHARRVRDRMLVLPHGLAALKRGSVRYSLS